MKRRVRPYWLWIVALAATGAAACVIVSDDNRGPVLGIELFWDEVASQSTFLGGTCFTADVERMGWSLEAEDGFEVAGVDDQPCRDRIEVTDIDPGDYTLRITGRDDDGIARWRTECTGLVIVRFNELYGCNIDSISRDGGDEPPVDGGVADGG